MSGADEQRAAAHQVRGDELIERIKEFVHEGNIRRIKVTRDDGNVVLDVPVTAGVIVVIMSPLVTALAAVAALTADYTIEIERKEPSDG